MKESKFEAMSLTDSIGLFVDMKINNDTSAKPFLNVEHSTLSFLTLKANDLKRQFINARDSTIEIFSSDFYRYELEVTGGVF